MSPIIHVSQRAGNKRCAPLSLDYVLTILIFATLDRFKVFSLLTWTPIMSFAHRAFCSRGGWVPHPSLLVCPRSSELHVITNLGVRNVTRVYPHDRMRMSKKYKRS